VKRSCRDVQTEGITLRPQKNHGGSFGSDTPSRQQLPGYRLAVFRTPLARPAVVAGIVNQPWQDA